MSIQLSQVSKGHQELEMGEGQEMLPKEGMQGGPRGGVDVGTRERLGGSVPDDGQPRKAGGAVCLENCRRSHAARCCVLDHSLSGRPWQPTPPLGPQHPHLTSASSSVKWDNAGAHLPGLSSGFSALMHVKHGAWHQEGLCEHESVLLLGFL